MIKKFGVYYSKDSSKKKIDDILENITLIYTKKPFS